MISKVLIVNPGSSGRLIRPKLQALGLVCDVYFENIEDPYSMLDRENTELYNSDISSVEINDITFLGYEAIIAGSELGVELTDIIADKCGLKGNSVETTELRRDKYAMQQALKRNNLSYIETYKINKDCLGLSSLNTNHAEKYIVKPLNSAGSEHVYFCNSRDEVINKISSLPWEKANYTGKINEYFLVQEFIQGDEYVVDLIVNGDDISVLSTCKYQKGKGSNPFSYNQLELLDPKDKGYSKLLDYAKKATKALDICFGLVHMEVILSPERGPVMIEAANRLHGGVAPSLFEQCYTTSLLDALAKLIIHNTVPKQGSELSKPGKIYFYSNSNLRMFSGFSDTDKDELLRIPSVIDYLLTVTPGSYLPVTVDLLTCPCLVWMANESEEQLQSDTLQVERVLSQVFGRQRHG
ncbi:ATP-grasp domain-containing protein [Photobacterium rosenbergii]|uniref:ATP-grasp domain-containing protein n=1 Tax=Photobacterium rosenbergii TaxID=294936 RepID=A0ABU3ZII3_9GAMM|nr:ATP-grasp domain-containing protein [Photobacterium rosenbergii]MDV5169708.1 ATP-grasp domain-containing protein [Photobacterium rosenbergii]